MAVEKVGIRKLHWEKQRWVCEAILALDVSAAPFDGEWVRIDGVHPLLVTLEGAFVGDVRILGSGSPVNRPGAGPDFPIIGAPLRGPGSVQVNGPYFWIKVYAATMTSGAFKAYGFANGPVAGGA